MESLEDALAGLRSEYLRETRTRLDDMTRLVDLLATTPTDRVALDALLRHFHALAGSGTTYGLPEITRDGAEGERLCGETQRAGHPAPPEALSRWRALLSAVNERVATASQSAESSRPSAGPSVAPSVPPLTDVLVVDDDAAVRAAARRVLEQEGLSVREAASLAEAATALAERFPNVLITDVMLEDGSGYDLVRDFRGHAAGESGVALVISKLSGFLDRVDAVQCGADGYFEKPLDWPALLKRLKHVLSREQVEPARVLAVEDDPQQAAFLKAVLGSAGYEVRICAEPRHFESDLTGFRPDIVLMDVMLPEISGFDLVRFVRQEERYATLPIVFLTTQGQIETRMNAVRAGGDELILKPVIPSLLLSTVAARVERYRLLSALLEKDGLTGLLTHTAFHERARSLVLQKQRDPDRYMAWVMLDVDHFKSVNDRYGHPAGDRVLMALGALMRRRLRQSDALGRYGGEEFAILLQNLTGGDAQRIVTRLLHEFSEIEHSGGSQPPFRVTFSAGVALLPETGTLDQWRKAADDALYEAKRSGRARVCIAAPSQ